MHTVSVDSDELQACKLNEEGVYAIRLDHDEQHYNVGTLTHDQPGCWTFHPTSEPQGECFGTGKDFELQADDLDDALRVLSEHISIGWRDARDNFLDDKTMSAFTHLQLLHFNELASRTDSFAGYTLGIAKALGAYVAEDLPGSTSMFNEFWTAFTKDVRSYADHVVKANKFKAEINTMLENAISRKNEKAKTH
jgi:hypothetical protein